MRKRRPKRNPTAGDLADFATWLERRGLQPGTVDRYRMDVALLLRGADPVLELRDEGRAPLTRHRMASALRQWCWYTSDTALLGELKELRLPPARRRGVKKPLDEDEWRALADEIDRADYLRAPERLVLCLMAMRGFRCGDVLRFRRDAIAEALRLGTLAFRGKGAKEHAFAAKHIRSYLKELHDQPGKWTTVAELISPRARKKDNAAWQQVRAALRTVGERLGFEKRDLHTHRFRRTYAVSFLRALEGDPEALQKLQAQMGWQNRETLFEYTDFVRAEDLEDVEEKMMRRRRG